MDVLTGPAESAIEPRRASSGASASSPELWLEQLSGPRVDLLSPVAGKCAAFARPRSLSVSLPNIEPTCLLLETIAILFTFFPNTFELQVCVVFFLPFTFQFSKLSASLWSSPVLLFRFLCKNTDTPQLRTKSGPAT